MADAPETSPIERPNTYELLAQRLLELIIDGELAVGEPLPSERELVERFHVGRSSVREALRVLESKGLIDGGGKGRFVVSTSPKPLNSSLQVLLELKEADIEELYELREVIEGATVAFAAERRTEDDLTAIAATIDDMAAGLGSPDEYIDADLSFHLAIARAGNNRIAVHMMQAIREILRRGLLRLYAVPGGPERSIAHHRAILEAVAAQDAAAARDRMLEHLRTVSAEVGRTAT
jgi:GntR family transcriptional repressor for pyruvate dehydrogenase complex